MHHPEMFNVANKENEQELLIHPLRNSNIQDRYESFSQYHTLWKMLSKDKSVLEEIESFSVLKIQKINTSALESKREDDTLNQIEQQPIGSKKNDFMSAILNKESVAIQVDKCCGMIGCEGCIDPVVEVIEEKDQEESFHLMRTTHHDSFEDESDDDDDYKSRILSSSSDSSSGGSTIVAFDISHLGVDEDGDHQTSSTSSKNPNESDLGLDISQITISPSLQDNNNSNDYNSIPSPCKSPSVWKDDSSSEEEWNDEDESNNQDDDILVQENTIIIIDDDDDDDESDYDNNEHESNSLVEESLTSGKSQKLSKQDKHHFKRNRDAITLATKQWFDKTVFKGALDSVSVTYAPRLTSTAGLTRLKTRTSKGIQTRLASIELSSKLIDDEQRLRSTLMHELCHAAAFLVDGVTKPPHGECFKKWANVAMKLIPEITVSTTHSYVTNTHKFAWACTNNDCRIIIKRHSNSVHVDKHVCGKCKSKLIEIEVNSIDSSVIVPKKKREASGFSLYVKQHSSSVRARLEAESNGNKVEQKEVMKELAVMWRKSKEKRNDNL